jgi:hypothetical protein
MGARKVVVISYKKGLLKKLYDLEQKKQYRGSFIGKNGKKSSEFLRGDRYRKESDDDYSYDKENDLPCYKCHNTGDGWHNSFLYYPTIRTLYIHGFSDMKYRWPDDEDSKEIIQYFESIMTDLCPDKYWDVYVTGDDCIYLRDGGDVNCYGDDLDEYEAMFEIPEPLRTPIENSRMHTLYGSSDQQDDEVHTIEDAVRNGNSEKLRNLLTDSTDSTDISEEIKKCVFLVACKLRHTNCVDVFLKNGGIVPDGDALAVSVSLDDEKTTMLLLDANPELRPTYDDVATAAVAHKVDKTGSCIFVVLLNRLLKVLN